MDQILCEVDCSTINVSPFQPRRYFCEKALAELAESIRTEGLIHPPVVRRIESNGKLLYYELITGERRWRAVKLLGMKTITVLVKNVEDALAARSAFVENLQRADLSPMEIAFAFRRLIEVFSMTQEEVAERVGKKRSTVANYLRMLSLPSKLREALEKDQISMGHAKTVLSLQDPSLREVLSDLIMKNRMTVREAEQAKRQLLSKSISNEVAHQSESAESVSTADYRSWVKEAFGANAFLEKTAMGFVIKTYFSDKQSLKEFLEQHANITIGSEN